MLDHIVILAGMGARPLRIALICQYFPPEVGAPQARLSQTAARWANAGHEVDVFTAVPNHPDGIVPPAYRRTIASTEQVDGYRVRRHGIYTTPNAGFIKKTLSHVSFAIALILFGLPRLGRPDAVVVSSPTFFAIFSGLVMARLKRAAFVIEVRDLWPGIFVELGVLTNRRIITVLEALELWAYGQADHVVVVTDGFKVDLVERGVPADKVSVITNGVDTERFAPAAADGAVRARLDGDAEVLGLYIGAHGISHALETVIDGADRAGAGVAVALVGDGARKPDLVEHADTVRPRAVSFHAPVASAEVPDLLRAVDVLIVSLRDIPLFDTFIPSKMFEYLATGLPVIGALRGEPAEILRRGGGIVVPPEDPDALAAALRAISPGQRNPQGPAFVAEYYDRSRLADRYAELLGGLRP